MAVTADGTTGTSAWSSGGGRSLDWFSPAGMSGTLKDIQALKDAWGQRDAAFKRFDDILAMVDVHAKAGIESMVANSAKTLFGLSKFMVASSVPIRTVVVGDQGPVERKKAGKAERAVYAWWQSIDDERIKRGEEPWQTTMAYWMCLYGWYATLSLTTLDDKGEPKMLAIAFDPKECYPEFGIDGLRSFVHVYDTNLGEAIDKARRYGTYSANKFAGDRSIGVTIADYWKHVGDDISNEIVLTAGGQPLWLKEPERMNVKYIPAYCGPFGGTPSRTRQNWMSDLGSVLADNERLYKDFDKWLGFMMQVAKEHAKAPILATGIELSAPDMQPVDVRDESIVLQTDNPEAKIQRVDVGATPIDIIRILTLLSSMEQRGGFPEPAYGGLMVEISGFGISQLLQAAERRIGPQVATLSRVDQMISKQWLTDFRDNDFPPVAIEGFEGGNPRKSFYEEFRPSDVPKKFRVSTNIPIRIANDMMSRMSIARQAVGNEQLLDTYTTLDEILQMQDPMLIIDRISEDRARVMAEPLTVAMRLRVRAAEIRVSKKPGAEETAQLIEAFAQQMMDQQQQQAGGAQGAPAKNRVAPGQMPPEARGVSPDQVRAAMSVGPSPNRTAAAQSQGVEV